VAVYLASGTVVKVSSALVAVYLASGTVDTVSTARYLCHIFISRIK